MPRPISNRSLLQLIDAVYSAALDPKLWTRFLKVYAEAAGATHASFKIFDFRNFEFSLPSQFGFSPEFLKAHDEYWGARDVYFLHARKFLHTGWVHQSQEFLPDDILAKSACYNECVAHEDIFHQCGVVIAHEDERNAILTTLRPRRAGAFGPSNLRLLRELLPHLQRATEIHYRMVALSKTNAAMEYAIDSFLVGVVFVDSKAKVLFANQAASQIFESRKGIWVEAGYVTATDVRQRRRLQELIHGASQTLISESPHPGGVLRIDRGELQQPLVVTVTPFPQRSSIAPHETAAALFITDPQRNGHSNEIILRNVYGLTAAETRLILVLFGGQSLKEAAETIGVTRNTVASQLKSIFMKTGTRRQSELLRLISMFSSQKIAA